MRNAEIVSKIPNLLKNSLFRSNISQIHISTNLLQKKLFFSSFRNIATKNQI